MRWSPITCERARCRRMSSALILRAQNDLGPPDGDPLVGGRERRLVLGARWLGVARLDHDRNDHDRAADERERAGALVQRQPYPERPQHDLEQRDEPHLRGWYQPRADGEQGEAEPDLADAERRQPPDVIAADRAGCGEGKEGRDEDRLREAR